MFLKIDALTEKQCSYGLKISHTPKTLFKTRNSKATWKDIMECTILDGDFTIATIYGGNITNEDFPVFPNLREITGSLLIYNARGLTSLEHIFPNLRVIGGQTLIRNYALVIYQNEDLRYIGLNNLKLVRNGGVRITDNAKLCFSRSINWNDIVIGKFGKVQIDKNGYNSRFSENVTESCQDFYGCKVDNPEKCQKMDGPLSCWNSTSCQTYCKYHKSGKGPGCSSLTGEKCHSSCLGGCEIPNDPTTCYACQKYKLNGECVEKCPANTYAHLDNRCLTKEECQNILPIKSLLKKDKIFWKAFKGKCHYNCPDGFQEDPTNPHNCIICEGYCPRKCLGGTIDSIKTALFYEKCNIIEGNLDINIERSEKSSTKQFTKAFGNIREITGNGEKVICDFYPINFGKVDFHAERHFDISFTKFNTSNLNDTVLLGYTVYYKKVEKIDPDLGYGDDIDGECDNQWKSKFFSTEHLYAGKENEGRAWLEYLELNTLYAYYIQTKVVSHPNAKHAISKIEFYKTPFKNPESPLFKKAEAIGSDKILLEWDPPIKANGNITHYTVMWNAKSIGLENGEHDFCGNNLNLESSNPSSLSFIGSMKSNGKTDVQKCHKCRIDKEVTKIEDESDEALEDTVMNTIYPFPLTNEEVESDGKFEDSILDEIFKISYGGEPIEYYCFDQYNLREEEKPHNSIANTEIYPEIYNENITFGRANISSTRVILTGLQHFTEYSIQIIACQDTAEPENSCSKNAAFKIVRTEPFPENDIIDLRTIKVFPYIVNGTEQGDSRIITWKIPDDPNGAILGFRYKIWRENDEMPPSERCISKSEFEKHNGVLVLGLNNGIYSFNISTVSSAGISESVVTKDLFQINVSNWFSWVEMLYLFLFFIIVIAASLYGIYRFYHFIDKKAKKYAQKIIPAKEQGTPLL
uniref:Receptor protein-tyrosine kinase n=1 Tax=Panagrolaimus sp. ES5 TaxID=591445 RepID=A0AC34GWW9_9BILA